MTDVYYGMHRTLEFQHGLLLEREDRIKRIEGDILDVNQIMRELAALVHQQGDTIGKHPFFTLNSFVGNSCTFFYNTI